MGIEPIIIRHHLGRASYAVVIDPGVGDELFFQVYDLKTGDLINSVEHTNEFTAVSAFAAYVRNSIK